MPLSQPATITATFKYRITLLLALIAAGLAGNYFRVPIFLNIDFLFGSIFAMLALQLFGYGRGILAAAAIAGYTYFAWNHPYAIIIMTAEVATVGWLMARRKVGMVLADTLFWLVVGMPLVYLFYHGVMHVPLSNTFIVMTKQAVNGIANTLVARLIFTCYAIRSRSSQSQVSLRELIYNLLAFFVLFPALLMLTIGGIRDFSKTDLHIRTALLQDSRHQTKTIEQWVKERKGAVINLAEMAASRSPLQMQPYLELTNKADENLLRVGLLDKAATTIAYSPLVDEQGKSNIGISAADRPYVSLLKKTLKPMLSEVLVGRIGIPKPRVFMLAPVVIHGQFGGYVIGVLDLEQIRAHLDEIAQNNATLYTLIDKNNNVIMTNRSEQTVMAPFIRRKGTLSRIGNGISQWVPEVPRNTPTSERWRNSFYSAETAIGDLAEWRLVLEQPVAPFQKTLYIQYTGKLILLFLILLGSLALAEVLTRRMMVTHDKLRKISRDLSSRLASGASIDWPESGIKETSALIDHFQEMGAIIQRHVADLERFNTTLEKKVSERTSLLTAITQELHVILENAPLGIVKTIDRKQVWGNRKWQELFQYSREEMEQQSTKKLYTSDDAYEAFGREAYPVLAEGLVFETERELVRKDGAHVLVRYVGRAIEASNMSRGTLWSLEDVTERKRAEMALQESEKRFKEMFRKHSAVMLLVEPAVGTIIDANLAAESFYGYSSDQLVTMNISELNILCSADIDGERQAALNDQRNYFVFPHLIAGGEIRTVEVHSTPITIDDKPLLFSIIHDITERKQAEETLRRRESELAVAQAISSVGSWRVVFGEQEEQWSGSDELYRIYGYPLTMPLTMQTGIDRMHPDDLEPVKAAWSAAIEGTGPLQWEHRIVVDGHIKWISVRVQFVFDIKGRLSEATGVLQDITGRKRMEDEILRALETARSVNDTMTRLLRTVAHEFRTPLGLLTISSDILDRYGARLTKKEHADQYEQIRNAVNQLSTLINSVISFNQSGTAGAGKAVSVLAVEPLCRIIADDVKTVWSTGHAYTVSIAADCGTVLLDGMLFRQILENLLTNAFRYTPANGSVALHVYREEQHLLVEVADSGIGVPVEDQKLIFDAFYRSSNVEGRRGLGLGLSIVHEALSQLGGSIAVTSSVGEGTVMVVKIPVVE